MKASLSSRRRPPDGRQGPRVKELSVPSALLLVGLTACNTGTIGEPGGPDPNVYNGIPSRDDDPKDAPACSYAPLGAAAPIARLTVTEYRNTLRSLLPGLSLPAVPLPADVVVEGFDNNARAQTPSATLVEQYGSSAEAVADSVVASLSTVLPCTESADDACATTFIDAFVTRAYRRPLTAAERTRYLELFRGAQAEDGFAPAIGLVVQAALQSPHFLYRVEANELAPLDGYALASRLSYFLWDDIPDEELLDAAASGVLNQREGVEAQARRMLEDPRARPAVASVFAQWLRFDKMVDMPKSAALFPEWNAQVASSARTGAERFVERVFWDMDGSLDALLTDTGTFVDERSASLYGITDAVSAMTLVQTNPEQRSGILTQAGLLAAFAHETSDSPILRGVFVMDRLLCSAPPPPPPGVTGSIVENTGNAGVPLTTRDRVALTHEAGECAGCHHAIDGFGFGFSHYDAIGRWRDTENGIVVNSGGWIDNTRDANGTFDGVVELGQRLAHSAQVSDCAASQWYRYALGLGAADVDSCNLAPIAKAFADSGGSLKELMITIATSDAFRTHGAAE